MKSEMSDKNVECVYGEVKQSDLEDSCPKWVQFGKHKDGRSFLYFGKVCITLFQ